MVVDGKVANGFRDERSYFDESSIYFSSGLLIIIQVNVLEGNVRVEGFVEINSIIVNFLEEIPDSLEVVKDEGVDGILTEGCKDLR